MNIGSLLVLLAVLDGGGVYGHFFHYSSLTALMGGAFLCLIYFWRRGELDMDEEPKFQMLKDEDE